MRSFDVLSPKQSILGRHFLEASAGTGKTFAIEHIVVRLLLQSSFELKNILVVTFTRAATRELKQRIRCSVQKALESLETENTKIPYLAHILEESTSREAGIRKLQEALSTFDQMQIFTIHGFCHQMLKIYAFDAGLGLEDGGVESLSYTEIQKEQILDFLRCELKEKKFHRHQIRKVLKKAHHDPNKLVSKITALLNKKGAFPELLDYDSLLEQFKAIISTYQHEGCLEEFLALAPLFKGLSSIQKKPHVHFLKQAELLESCLKESHQIEKVFNELLAEDECFFEYLEESFLKKTVKKPFDQLLEQFPLLKLQKLISPLLLEAVDETKILLRIAGCCKERVEKALSSHGITPPDDLLDLMRISLNRKNFCKNIQERYQAAIIDEFQDTDPIQWDIVDTLFACDREDFPLYLVGDPKQSIYGFRNADLPTYLKAARKFSAHQKYSLSTNYRSEPRLITALNKMFLASSQWLSSDESLVYTEVESNPEAKNTDLEDGYGSVHFFVAKQEKEKQAPSKQTEQDFLFPFIAQEILKFSAKKISLNSFAVLIRDRFQAERLESYLQQMKIPCRATSVVNITDTMAFRFLKMLLGMLGRLEHLQEVKMILAHPFMGFSHEDLKVGGLSTSALQAINQLKILGEGYFQQGFLRFWDEFLQTCFDEKKISFEEKLVSQDLQHYQDLTQIVEILAQYHQFGKTSHEELLYVVARLEEMEPEENEMLKRRASLEEEAVTIMTMHKSKGLEFEIVFALGVCAASSMKEEVIRCKDKLMITDSSNALHLEVLQQTEREKLRQLYVALTRAKKRVYIPVCCRPEMEAKAPIELFLKEIFRLKHKSWFTKEDLFEELDLFKDESISYTDLIEPLTLVHTYEQKDQLSLFLPQTYTKRFEGLYSSSYSKMAHEVTEVTFYSKNTETSLLPASAETGNVFHNILEKIFERGVYLNKDHESIKYIIAQETYLSHLAGLEEHVQEIINQVLKTRLRDGEKEFSFQDLHPSHLVTELEFLLEDSSTQVFKGFMDLFFEYQGKYYLVDWKSNFLGSKKEDYTQEALKECMEKHHYFIQAELYGKVIKKYLKHLGKNEDSYRGMFYLFLRGLDEEQGIYYVQATQ